MSDVNFSVDSDSNVVIVGARSPVRKGFKVLSIHIDLDRMRSVFQHKVKAPILLEGDFSFALLLSPYTIYEGISDNLKITFPNFVLSILPVFP